MIEIQIVPSDIRRRVRYVFFDRRRVVVGLVALSFVLAALLGSMAAAPTVIRRVYKDNYLKSMRDERDIQRGRLQENVVQMTSLEKSLEEQPGNLSDAEEQIKRVLESARLRTPALRQWLEELA